jgi:hypothetical protein
LLPTRGRQKGAWRHAEGHGDLDELQHPHIPDAALDAAHVGSVDSGLVRECLLGQSPLFAQLTDAIAEGGEVGVSRGCHGPYRIVSVDDTSTDDRLH